MKLLIVLSFCFAVINCMAPLYKHSKRVPNKYIVKFKDNVEADYVKDKFQKKLEKLDLKNAIKGTTKRLKTVMMEIPENKLDKVLDSDDIEFIEEEFIVQLSAVGSWGLDRIDQGNLPLDEVYAPEGNGLGVNVYVLDTGILYTHEEFEGRASFGFEVYNDGMHGVDCNGHGTHTAGTIAGMTFGVAKKANIWGVKVQERCSGSFPAFAAITAMDWVITHAATQSAPSVASMSFGGGQSFAINDAVANMVESGITAVTAAGNDATRACNYSPANSPMAITVGSSTTTDARSPFSNYGSCVDIFAPGSSIRSAGIWSNVSIVTKSGTSMACPHVAGAAALLLGANTALSPTAVKSALINGATEGVISNAGSGSPNLLLKV